MGMSSIINNDGTVYYSDGYLFDDDGLITNMNDSYASPGKAADIVFDFSQEVLLLTREEAESLPAFILGDLDTNLLGVDLGVIDPRDLYLKYGDEDTISRPELHTLRILHF